MKKKLNEYLHRSVRKLKHRKGFGVHSPFAFAVITEVIEEKLPYYAYSSMQRRYDKKSNIPFKVVCLLFRLANRFRCHNIAILGEEQYAVMPLTEVDSRNQLTLINDVQKLTEVADQKYDMIVVNANCLDDDQKLSEWLLSHTADGAVIFVKGIQSGHALESVWDSFCDYDEMPITMDLYDYGLAIKKPNFYKQHYIVSF